MSQRDFYHEHVRAALLAAGWTITQDPLTILFYGLRVGIDLGAERTEADGSKTRIAVEVKNFRKRSDYVNEFEKGLGQYLLYREVIETFAFNYTLFLAVPDDVYQTFFQNIIVNRLIQKHGLNILTYIPTTQTLVQWLPFPNFAK